MTDENRAHPGSSCHESGEAALNYGREIIRLRGHLPSLTAGLVLHADRLCGRLHTIANCIGLINDDTPQQRTRIALELHTLADTITDALGELSPADALANDPATTIPID